MSDQNVIPFDPAKLPAAVAGQFADELSDDLISGGAGYGIVSIRGSKWRMKFEGEERVVLDANGDPVASLEVVLVKASADVSKQYFGKAYGGEGDDSAPICLSIDGKTPDGGSPEKQCDTCAACPHNQWGSKIAPSGKKTKACQDSKRVAVVPLYDLKNASYGGPMLLRVPAASLKDLARFGQLLKGKGFPYNTVAVRLGFDHNASYPKLTFKAVRALEPAELSIIAELKSSESVERILHDAYNGDAPAPTEAQDGAVDVEFEQPAAAPATAPAAAPQAPAAQPVPAPEVATVVADDPVAAAEAALAKAKAERAAKQAASVQAAPAAQAAPAPAPAPEGDSLADDIDSIISDLDGLGG